MPIVASPSTNLPEWATTANFPAGSHPWSGQPRRDSAGMAALAAAGFIPRGVGEEDEPSADSEPLNAWLGLFSEWATFFRVGLGSAWYGDGSDGNVTISSGTTTLTRDMYYADLTISGSAVLRTSGYRVFVSGTLTVGASASIRNNGSTGGTPADASTGGTGGSAAPGGSLGAGFAGGAGASNANGTAGTNATDSLGGTGGAGGDSNDTGTGGAASTVTAPVTTRGGWRHLQSSLGRASDGTAWRGGAGGSGGGGGDTGAGGGGGGGGGIVAIFARVLVLNGSVQANGGDGGPGFNGPDAAGNGGGGGGGGGAVFIVSRQRSGSGTVTANGGAGGAPYLAGDAGDAGTAGLVIEMTA